MEKPTWSIIQSVSCANVTYHNDAEILDNCVREESRNTAVFTDDEEVPK